MPDPHTGTPVGSGAPADAERMAVAFVRVLRGAGFDVPIGATIVFVRALGAVGMRERDGVYWAARTTLVTRPDEIARFDRAFAAFWVDSAFDSVGDIEAPEPEDTVLGFDAPDADQPAAGVERADMPVVRVRYSATEVLRHRDFATYTQAEFAEARRLTRDLRLAGALRRSRRTERSRHQRGRPDLRRTVRRALRAGGEPVVRAFREPSTRRRAVVLILDVSGSMEPYARAFLRFFQAAVVSRSRVEAFTLGTRVTRVTRELSVRSPDAALVAAAQRVTDWSGGTRLGECLREFNDQWGVRGIARGAVVVIVSDGWDRGAPNVIAEQLARLGRVAHRIVWVNPLKASPGYAPLARGMAAALPYIDEFVEGHSLAALETLADVMADGEVGSARHSR
ncbi:MAG TPA: VWA domain-containing protein [Acidimicrobiia bacterium]